MSVSGSVVDRIAAVATVQRGFVSRGQLRAAAVGPTAIARLIAKRWLRPKHRAVFAVGHDHSKDAALRTAGIIVDRVTWRQLNQEPLAVIARVSAGLRPLQAPPAR